MDTRHFSRRASLAQLFLVFFGFFLMYAGWAVSSPIGAGPDETVHVLKAAGIAHGDLIGEPAGDAHTTIVTVPTALASAYEWSCFAFNPAIGGNCQGELEVLPGTADINIHIGSYNPLYYMLIGWPSLFSSDPTIVVVSMRLLTALGSALLTTLIFSLVSKLSSRMTSLAVVLATLTPMVFFLNGIVNPNAWEILGGLAFTSGLLWFARAVDVHVKVALYAAMAIGIGGFISATTRSLSPLWLFLIGVVFLSILTRERFRELLRLPAFLSGLGFAVVGAIASVLWTLAGGSLKALWPTPGTEDMGFIETFVRMALEAPSAGLIGNFGWLDTPAPGFAVLVYGFASVGPVIAALAWAETRWKIAVVISLAFFLFAPAFVQAGNIHVTGWIWQPRYSLLLFCVVVLTAAFALMRPTWRAEWESQGVFARMLGRFSLVTVGALLIAQAWSFIENLQRYVSPRADQRLSEWFNPVWSPALFGVRGVVFIYVSGALLIILAVVVMRREQNQTLKGQSTQSSVPTPVDGGSS